MQDADELFPEKADADTLFPAAPEQNRQAGVQHSPVQDWLFGDETVSPIAKVLNGFGQGVQDNWGADGVGMSEEMLDEMKKVGIKADDWLEKRGTLAKAANVAVIRPAAQSFYNYAKWWTHIADRVLPSAIGGVTGAISAVNEPAGRAVDTALEAGMDPGLVMSLQGIPVPPVQVAGLALRALQTPLRMVERARELRLIGRGEAGAADTGPVEQPKPAVTPKAAELAPQPVTGAPEESQALSGATAGAAAPQAQDIHAAVRQAAPELFDHYDAIVQQKTALEQWVWQAGQEGTQAPAAQTRLAELNAELNTIAPQVAQAYRETAARLGGETVEPAAQFRTMTEMLAARAEEGVNRPPVPEAPEGAPPRTIDEQRQFIADDLAKKLIAAGRPEQEAKDSGAVAAANYVALSGLFRGKIGTAEEIYRREGPDIRGGAAAPATTARPPQAPTAAEVPIDNTHTVVSGANSSRDPNGPVYIDPAIPEFSPKLKYPNGQPVRLWTYIAEHETAERAEMLRFEQEFRAQHGREPTTAEWNDHYDNVAHPQVANVAEQARLRADGVDIKAYNDEIDGYLDHIEREKNENPPAETITDPEADIGHHRSSGKAEREPVPEVSAEARKPPEAPVPEPVITPRPPGPPRGPAAQPEETWSLLQFLAANGGIRADDPLISDLRGSFGGENRFIPGFGQLIRPYRELSTAAKSGGRKAAMTLDQALRAAIDAGYIEEPGDVTGGAARRNIDDLLQAIDEEARGNRVYRRGYLPEGRPADPAELEYAQHQFMEGLNETAREFGSELTDKERARALEIWHHEGLNDHGSILERLALETRDAASDAAETGGHEPYIPGWDDAAFSRAAPRAGELPEAVSGAERAAGGTAARTHGEGAGAQDVWQRFVDRRVEARPVSRTETSYNKDTTKSGAPVRAKVSQEWVPGNLVNVGIVKDLLVAEKRDDGSYTLVAKPNAQGKSRSYNTKPHGGIVREKDVDFLRATKDLQQQHEAEQDVAEATYFQRKPRVPIEPSPEYEAARESHNQAFQEFRQAQDDYRSRKEKDFDAATKTFLAARAKFDEANRAFDEAHTNEAKRAVALERAQRGPRNLFAEREAQGQLGLPGTERITDAERAQRAANAPLKPAVEQKPMDVGLFGDTDKQKELFQQKRYTREELERMDIDDLDRMAYGHVDGETVTLRPDQIKIKYPGDLENPQDKFEKQGMKWVRSVDRSEPVDVSIGQDGEFYLEDGHHRWFAAQKLNEPITAKIERITGKPIETILQRQEREFSQSQLGKVLFREGKRPIITLAKTADASTFMHELGHVFLEQTMHYAQHPEAPDILKNDGEIIKQWLGVNKFEDIKTRHHEKFARGFEQYLREGVAPSKELAGVFARFRDWMLRIYQTLKGLGSEITPEIRGVFDRLLAESPQRTVIAPEVAKRPDLQDIHENDARLTEPHHAEAAADAIETERQREAAALPPDIADEHSRGAAQTGTSPAELAPLREPVAPAEPVGEGGAGGAQPGPQPAGGGEPVPESPRLRVGQGEAGKLEVEAVGPHVPLDSMPDKLTDKVGNIRLENLNTPADVNEAIRALYRENKDRLDAATRGRVGDQAVMDLADAMGVNPAVVANNMDRLRAMSLEDNVPLAARVWLMRDVFTKLAAEVSKAMQGDDVAAFAEARQRFLMAHETLSGITAEIGRGLRAFRSMGGAVKDANLLAAMLKEQTGKTLFQLRQEMALGRAAETPAQVARMVNDAERSTYQKVRSGIISYVINNLISGPVTHAAYSVGNAVVQLFRTPEMIASSLAGRGLQAMGVIKAEDRIRMGEAGQRLYGMVYGAIDGWSASVSALRTGVAVMKGDPSGIDLFSSETAYRPQQIPGRAGYVLETPSRAVAAIHTMHYGMNYEAEIAAMGYRDAIAKGFEPGSGEFNAHVADFRQNPPADAMAAAHQTALEMVLMRKPAYGGLQNYIERLTNQYLVAKLIAPFVRIGGNILRGAFIERTPLAFLDKGARDNLLGRNGPARQQEQYGRVIMGTTLATATIGFATQGIITGGGPSDPKQREVLEMTGWKPYSIKIGGEFIPYRKYLGQLGPLVAGAADMYEIGHALSDKGLADAAAALSFGFAEVVADETWMRGISSFIDAARHWDRDGAKYLRNVSMEFIPFSIGLKQIASLTDPTWRSVRSEMDALRAHIPGLSQTLYPVRDLWGNPQGGGVMMAPSAAVNDPATAALQKAEYYPARMSRKIRGVELSDAQYDDLTRIAGRDAHMHIQAMVSNPGFDLLPKEIRQKQLKDAMDNSRDMARGILLMSPVLLQAIRLKQQAQAAAFHQ